MRNPLHGLLLRMYARGQRRRDEEDARVLAAIRANVEPSYGYGLWKTPGVPRMGLYAALDRLERQGRIVSYWEQLPSGSNRPRRRMYEAID